MSPAGDDNRAGSYIQHGRNPERNVQIGGAARSCCAQLHGSPAAFDLDNGRQYATLEDFKTASSSRIYHPTFTTPGGTVCEPVDIPVSKRHLDMIYSHLRYSDKPFMGSVTEGSRAQDSVDMARIGFGGDLADRTVMTSLINASSPLIWDATMLHAAEVYALNNQACIMTPFICAVPCRR
ncbi:MAG: trimethylamine methyltransferase family protein [Acidimicrobiales bacterium]